MGGRDHDTQRRPVRNREGGLALSHQHPRGNVEPRAPDHDLIPALEGTFTGDDPRDPGRVGRFKQADVEVLRPVVRSGRRRKGTGIQIVKGETTQHPRATYYLLVNDHDFRSTADFLAVPYGILDLQANCGRILLGTSHDTATFAVDAIRHYWTHEGRRTYPDAKHILIYADNGGSNGSRVHLWKYELQTAFCDPFKVAVTVCHYPPGSSKWNAIEHRLFAAISNNWQGRPLETLETILKYIRTTKTNTGLKVYASCTRRRYPKGVSVSPKEMASLNLQRHKVLPAWNYTILPAGWTWDDVLLN